MLYRISLKWVQLILVCVIIFGLYSHSFIQWTFWIIVSVIIPLQILHCSHKLFCIIFYLIIMSEMCNYELLFGKEDCLECWLWLEHPPCNRCKLKLIKLLSVTTLLYLVIYCDFILHVSACFGHHQVYLIFLYWDIAGDGQNRPKHVV